MQRGCRSLGVGVGHMALSSVLSGQAFRPVVIRLRCVGGGVCVICNTQAIKLYTQDVNLIDVTVRKFSLIHLELSFTDRE